MEELRHKRAFAQFEPAPEHPKINVVLRLVMDIYKEMLELDDHELLAQYVGQRSEEAFAALVRRYINLVYSVALRHTSDPHDAEDIAQAVFLLLARKAASLSSKTVVSGWLYRAAQLTAANYVRSELRRQHREQEAQMQSFANEPEAELWTQMAPMLDTAMGRLRERDRDALVLRYFEGKSNREVGAALGTSEAAAQKSIERALAKLRGFFSRRGLTISTATLATLLSVHAVQAAPAGLAVSIMAAGIAKGASAQGVSVALMKSTLKIMTWLKIETALATGISTILVAGVATSVVVQLHKATSTPPPGSIIALSRPTAPPASAPIPRRQVLDKQVYADSSDPAPAEPASAWPGNLNADDAKPEDIASAPQDAPSYIRRGKAYLADDAYDKAIVDFNQALRLDTKSAVAYFNLGRAHKLKGDYTEALSDYTQAIQLNPKMVAAYVNRGQIFNMAQRYDDSIADFDQAIALAPQRPIPYLNRGVAFGAKAEYDKARADFSQTIALAPDFSPGYNNLAWMEATCPQAAFLDGKDAVQNATKACQLTQWQNINQIDTLAAACAEAGDFDNAIKWETQVLQSPILAPEDVTTARERLALYQTRQSYHRPPPTVTGTNP
jgi:RNA polymerase sigma factor (sigma-70 family)